MSESANLLEILQDDVYRVLKALPALVTAGANVISDNEGDIENRVTQALKTLTATSGKSGLAVVVMLPEVTEAEKNLPGPMLTLKIEIRTIERVLTNRNASTGTLTRSSQASLIVLAALHLRHLGNRLLFAQKDPVAPVDVKAGFVSHSVTLYSYSNGLVTAKPPGVSAQMQDSQLVLTAGGNEASIFFTLDGTFPDSAVNAGDYTPGVLAPGTYSYFTTGPLSGLPAGTVVRAAVWLEDLGFGDVLELVVTA